MVRIIRVSDGQELGITDAPTYIKYGDGCLTNATEKDAIGVAYQSIPYNLFGHDEIEGAETVVISHIDGGNYLAQQKSTADALMASMLEG